MLETPRRSFTGQPLTAVHAVAAPFRDGRPETGSVVAAENRRLPRVVPGPRSARPPPSRAWRAVTSTTGACSLVSVDPARAARGTGPGSGSVIVVHPLRTTGLLLAALLAGGCVGVPHAPAPRPSDRSAHLVPAAERPPSPLPSLPTLAPAAPREDLSATDPLPGLAPPRARTRTVPEAAKRESSAAGTAARRPPPDRPAPVGRPLATERGAPTKSAPTRGSVGTRTKPSSVKGSGKTRTKPRSPQKQQPRSGQVPEMRELCRQAQGIQAPMGAAELCRSMYGR